MCWGTTCCLCVTRGNTPLRHHIRDGLHASLQDTCQVVACNCRARSFETPWLGCTPVASQPRPHLSLPQAACRHMNERCASNEERQGHVVDQHGPTKNRTSLLSGEDIMGHILEHDTALLPTAASPRGRRGSLLEYVLYVRSSVVPHGFRCGRPPPTVHESRHWAHRMNVRHGMLDRATMLRKQEHPDMAYMAVRTV